MTPYPIRQVVGVCIFLCLFISSLSAQGVLADAQQSADAKALIGRWSAQAGNQKLEVTFDNEGFYYLNGKKGIYKLQNGNIFMKTEDSTSVYALEAGSEFLTFSGAGLKQSLKFSRQKDLEQTLGGIQGWVDITSPGFYKKIWRLLIIIGILVMAQLLIFGLGLVSRFLIFSNWGPVGLLFRHNKNRQMTLHSIALNVLKYIIYFTVLGFVLSEIGVDYTAYLASLSVIGLAIGFGSQGLVQDFVTGFFIVLEGQFQVGDMVEISGQTGIVEELGLRMTKIRNYFGQTICLPNRNIALVGTFKKGALGAYADIALANETDFDKAQNLARVLGEELFKQFPEIFFLMPMVQKPVRLETGELFLRIHMTIWPAQQWVLEQQFVLRLKGLFSRQNISIFEDRVVLFYHEPG